MSKLIADEGLPIREPNTVRSFRRNNEAAGQNWFSPATLRFFEGRVSGDAYGPFFVSSERCSWADDTDEPYARTYTVRRALPDGSIGREGEQGQYATAAAATAAAKAAAAALASEEEDGVSGQDRESYTDDQDRDSYTV